MEEGHQNNDEHKLLMNLELSKQMSILIEEETMTYNNTQYLLIKIPNPLDFYLMLFIEHLQDRILLSSTRDIEFIVFDTFPNLKHAINYKMTTILLLKSPNSNRTETLKYPSNNLIQSLIHALTLEIPLIQIYMLTIHLK